MVQHVPLECQLLCCQGGTKVWVSLLITSQHRRFELCRVSSVRRPSTSLMHQTAIALLVITFVESAQIAILQLTECCRFLLLQLATLHSFKDLKPLALFRAHLQMSLHLPTLSGAAS